MQNLLVNHISKQTINFVQENFWDCVKEQLSKRIAIVAVIALSSLTALYLLCRYSFRDEDSANAAKILKDPVIPSLPADLSPKLTDLSPKLPVLSPNPIDQPKKSPKIKTPSPMSPLKRKNDAELSGVFFDSLEKEKKLIHTLKKNWLDDPQKETQRLIDSNVLTDIAQQNIDKGQTSACEVINTDKGQQFVYIPIKDEVSMVLGRVLELKHIYSKTHYVFTHGQSLGASVANQVVKYFVRAFNHELDQPLKVHFRIPNSVPYSANADEYIDKYDAVVGNDYYSDNDHSAETLSVDAQFWNNDGGESALDLFSVNKSILAKGLSNLFESIFFHYVPDEKVSEMLVEKALKIAAKKQEEAKVGALYAICVPKAIIQDAKKTPAYPSHPYGRRCDCHSVSDRLQNLEKMQKDESYICKGDLVDLKEYRTQYRLLTSRLMEEDEVRSFAVNSLAKDKRKEYRDEIKALVEEAVQYSQLCKLLEDLDKDPSVMHQIRSFIEVSTLLDPHYVQHLFEAKGISVSDE